MDYNYLSVRLNQNLQIGSTIEISTKELATDIVTNYIFTFVTTRSAPFEITYEPSTVNAGESALLSLQSVINTDIPSIIATLSNPTAFSTDFTISCIDNIPNVVLVFPSESFNINFSEGVDADYILLNSEQNRASVINIDGLYADNYLINNEIWIDISNVTIADFVTIKLKNLSNQKETLAHKLYLLNGQTSFNLQPLIKSIFDNIGVSNVNKFSITYKVSFVSVQIEKFFIRGGIRTENTNQFLTPNTILRNSVNLPYWNGYTTSQYVLNSSSIIQEVSLDYVENKELRREKSCNSLYLKFLNQKGGYSNWLFETYKMGQDNTPLGAYYSGRRSVDLGSEVDFDLQVFSKVPKEYIGLIKDLFVSPEVYYLTNQKEWIRIYNAKNSIDEDLNKKTYAVQGKFNIINRFNPSVLWSN